jgi:hypothetical protein
MPDIRSAAPHEKTLLSLGGIILSEFRTKVRKKKRCDLEPAATLAFYRRRNTNRSITCGPSSQSERDVKQAKKILTTMYDELAAGRPGAGAATSLLLEITTKLRGFQNRRGTRAHNFSSNGKKRNIGLAYVNTNL